MSEPFPLPRRGVLTGGVGALATAALGGGTGSAGAQDVGSSPTRNIAALDLEVTTVTESSLTVYWTTHELGPDGRPRPVAADTELLVGPADGSAPPRTVVREQGPTHVHLATAEGLDPGRDYRFEARSRGVRAVASSITTNGPTSPERLGVVTTLTPPPGEFVRTVAVLNDVHIGETAYGIVTNGFPPPAIQEDGRPPFAGAMLLGALQDIRDRGVGHVFVNGDLTSEATPHEVAHARELLDGFGPKGPDAAAGQAPTAGPAWWATRGNHDRPHRGPDYASCPVYAGEHRDCWGGPFVPRQSLWVAEAGGLRVIGLDSTHLDAAGGVIEPEQFAHLERLLREDPDRPTMVLCHHPVTRDAASTNLAGPPFVLAEPDAQRLQRLLAAAPGAFLHLAGHTHRNRRNRADIPGGVEYLEVANTSGYPGMYTLVHLFTGGYLVTVRRIPTPEALAWTARSRAAYLGGIPEYSLGGIGDRCLSVTRSLPGI